jgi:hypothetical protein
MLREYAFVGLFSQYLAHGTSPWEKLPAGNNLYKKSVAVIRYDRNIGREKRDLRMTLDVLDAISQHHRAPCSFPIAELYYVETKRSRNPAQFSRSLDCILRS